jgi:hypothetical protein
MLNRRYQIYLSKLRKANRLQRKATSNIDSKRNAIMVSYLNSIRGKGKKK